MVITHQNKGTVKQPGMELVAFSRPTCKEAFVIRVEDVNNISVEDLKGVGKGEAYTITRIFGEKIRALASTTQIKKLKVNASLTIKNCWLQ